MKDLLQLSTTSERKNKIIEGRSNAEETELKKYFNSPLETVSCLKYWERREQLTTNKVMSAICRLAKRFLTPQPTSTDVERLFSIASLVADDKREKLLPTNLDKLLFLRENIMTFNFDLSWD